MLTSKVGMNCPLDLARRSPAILAGGTGMDKVAHSGGMLGKDTVLLEELRADTGVRTAPSAIDEGATLS